MRLGVRAYRTPFTRAIGTARGEWTHREGAWVVVADREGRFGIGEVTPLPAWGTETLEEAIAILTLAAERRVPALLDPRLWGIERDAAPAAYAGVELAIWDGRARFRQQPLALTLLRRYASIQYHEALDPDSSVWAGQPATRVPVNALLTGADVTELTREAEAAVAAGYRAIKLKVGDRPRAAEIERVRAVREAVGPDVALRLDANGGWSREEATARLAAFAAFAPDYVEQPVAASDLEGLIAVGRATGVTVAADEAAGSLEAARRCLAAGVPVLVVKPMALGGLLATAELAVEAAGRARLVLTSALDRGVATAGVLHLAAALHLEEPCGLATGRLFAASALDGLEAEGGHLATPTGPGLGVPVRAPELLSLIEEVRHAAMADG